LEERLPTAEPAGITLTGSDEHSGCQTQRPLTEAGAVVLDYCTAVKGFSTTTREVRCTHLAYGWPKPCEKYGSHWSEISR